MTKAYKKGAKNSFRLRQLEDIEESRVIKTKVQATRYVLSDLEYKPFSSQLQ